MAVSGGSAYEVKKVKDGYKVCRPDTDKCFSKKPLSRDKAKAQLRAIYANENKKRGAEFKRLESKPTSTYTAILSTESGAPAVAITGNKYDIARQIGQSVKEPGILNRMSNMGVTNFGNKATVFPADGRAGLKLAYLVPGDAKSGLKLKREPKRKREGAGLFDWFKKAGSAVASAAKSGLSSIISNVTSNTQPTTEIGDKFLREQTKLFSPSGREDEPGIPPGQVIQNFQPNPLMPDTKTLYQMNKAAYDNSTQDIGPYRYVTGSPTLKIYNKGAAIIVAVRGTADNRDILTDITIAAQDLANRARYKEDLQFLRQFQVQYPPGQYVYLLTGHSLGGAICDQLMKDGIGEQAITFNPAVQKDAYNSQNNKRIYQSEDPLYRMMGRYCRYNVEVRENRAKGALEQALSYAPIAGVGYTALKAHSLDNYVGGMMRTSVHDRPHLRPLQSPY